MVGAEEERKSLSSSYIWKGGGGGYMIADHKNKNFKRAGCREQAFSHHSLYARPRRLAAQAGNNQAVNGSKRQRSRRPPRI